MPRSPRKFGKAFGAQNSAGVIPASSTEEKSGSAEAVDAPALSNTSSRAPDAGHGKPPASNRESAGPSRTWNNPRDFIERFGYRNERKTEPAFVPVAHILALREAARNRLDALVLEAGRTAIAGDIRDAERFAVALSPFVEEAAHLRYMLEFLVERASGLLPETDSILEATGFPGYV